MRLLTAGLVALLIMLQLKLWFGDGGVRELHQVRAMADAQRIENDRLLERNRALATEVRDLKEGTEALEERARAELGLVGPDETFIQIVSRPGRGD